MQSKSPSVGWKSFSKRIGLVALGLGACALSFVLSRAAFAAVTVTPADTSERVPVDSVSNGVLEKTAINANSVYYYPVSDSTHTSPVSTTVFPDTGFRVLNADATFLGEASGSRSNMVLFEVGSTTAVGTSLGLVVQIRAAVGTEQLVPIAQVGTSGQNLVDCNATTLCETAGVSNGGISTDHRFIVKYTSGTKVTIGLYPKDLCADYKVLAGADANGCSGGAVEIPGSAEALEHMPITFKIVQMGAAVNAAPTLTSSLDTISLLLGFQNTAPTLNCDLTNGALYFPGDSQILLNTGFFGVSVPGTNRAPGTHVVVVGNVGSAPVVDSTFATANTLVKRVLHGGGVKPVDGFTNTTDGADNAYQLQFMMRDASGLLAAPNGASCLTTVINPVQTAALQGLLSRSSCFIASAAFADPEAEPVRWLRAFRDSALMPTRLGRAFVEVYYEHSPSAARWLLEHPGFRLPVLYALVPFQIVAWFWMRPEFFALFVGHASVLVAGALWASRRARLRRKRVTG